MPGFFCCQCVSTGHVGIIERCGRYESLAEPGFTCMLWPLDCMRANLNTRVQQLDVQVSTKTKDDATVVCLVSVQYKVKLTKVYDAFYKLEDHKQQITAYVFDVVRSTLPKLTLDQAFECKDDIAHAVKSQLDDVMDEYGFEICKALVTDLDPATSVKNAMNEINASKRLKEAAHNKAEAAKIMQVKAAEAEAESKYLSGVGVAKQRKAIVEGLRDSISDFSKEISGTSPKDVMDLLLLTQYFDMLKDVGQNSRSSTIFLPHTPETVAGLQAAMRNGFMQGAAGVGGGGGGLDVVPSQHMSQRS